MPPTLIKADLVSRIGDALIHITFSDVGFDRKRSAVADVLSCLRTVDVGFSGELRPDALAGVVASIRVMRVQLDGPFFDVDAVGSFADPTLDGIRAKWSKRYETAHTIELLAYYELQPGLPEQFWRPRFESFLNQNWQSSPFQRVWVYDCATRRVAFVAEHPR